MLSMFLCCATTFSQNQNLMKKKPYTIEVVVFESNPNYTEEQIEMSVKQGKKLGGPVFGGAFFILMSVFFGFIYSLISGLIMQKKEE